MSEVAKPKRSTDGGFRVLLVVGAIVTIVLAVWGLVWTDMLRNVLGLRVPPRAFGLARLFGATMLAIGIGYALAAAQPQRSRSLLVPLFVVPMVMAGAMVFSIARGDVFKSAWFFVIYNAAYCFLYFRMYPRVPEPERAGPSPAGPSPESPAGPPGT